MTFATQTKTLGGTALATMAVCAGLGAQTPAPAKPVTGTPPAPPVTSAAAPGLDCWMPRWEIGTKNPRWAPMRPALDAVEKAVKANQAFMSEMPEGVRMEVQTLADDALGMIVSAYPRQHPFSPASYWSSTGCNIVTGIRSTRQYEHPIGFISVGFNRRGFWRASDFNQSRLKPVRVVAGFPVFESRSNFNVAELLIITKDGRIPIVPITLADRLDQEATFLATRLEEVRAALAAKPQAAVEAIQRREQTELLRQVEALRAYRASFTPEELRSAWIPYDGAPSPELRRLEAEVKALQALSPDDQAQVNALGARVRALQVQARTRGTAPDEATRLRQEASTLLTQANAIALAQQQRVDAQVTALRNDFKMKTIRPGDASEATQFKDDPTFYDSSDPNRIQLITVDFHQGASAATTYEQAKAWMDKVEATFDYQALKALIR